MAGVERLLDPSLYPHSTPRPLCLSPCVTRSSRPPSQV
jgi:hypothetical protein